LSRVLLQVARMRMHPVRVARASDERAPDLIGCRTRPASSGQDEQE
jgi:hypothetical protein